MKLNTFLAFYILFLGVSLSAGQEEGGIRLAGGRDITEGRVEIFHNGAWGTVCDDNWDIQDAHVVCRQLHFPRAIAALGSSTFGNGKGNIWMEEVLCDGTETKLLRCTFPGWGIHNCQHSEDAGVRCDSTIYDLDHNASLPHQLGMLFDSGRDCDLNISIVIDNNTMEIICAHRLILSLNPDLKTSKLDSGNLTIDATYDCSEHVSNFVRYFYTRKIKMNQASAHCFLKMASNWGLTEILKESTRIFQRLLPDDPSFLSQNLFYEYAVWAGDKALEDVYLHYLALNCEALTRSPGWTILPFSVVKALLLRSDLVVHNETVLLKALERWAEAQENTTVPEVLLKLIRFPMIPAEDLNTLNGSQYYTSMFQGFQFNALPFTTLPNHLTDEQTAYTSRIYNGSPWSFTFDYQAVKANADDGQGLISYFHTPVHNSAYFTLNKLSWKTTLYVSDEDCLRDRLTCLSLPTVSLKVEERDNGLPSEMERRIRYSNKLVVMCEGRYVVHVGEFSGPGYDLVFVPSGAEQVYPCDSNQFSYQVVVRPYSTD